jgi:hypothetical protein
MEKCNNHRLHAIHMEMDEDEAIAVDVPIEKEPELDPSELLDLEFDVEEDDVEDDIIIDELAVPESSPESI